MAGLGQGGAQDAGADDAALGRVGLEQIVVVAQTVDQRHGDGALAHDGGGVADRVDELGGLGHVDDDVDLALGGQGLLRGGVGAEALQDLGDVAVGAALLQMDGEGHAVGGDLAHMLAIAVDEDDVRAAAAQIRGEDAAGAAGAVHGEFHKRRLLSHVAEYRNKSTLIPSIISPAFAFVNDGSTPAGEDMRA